MTEFDKIFQLKLGVQTYNWGKVSLSAGYWSAVCTDISDISRWDWTVRSASISCTPGRCLPRISRRRRPTPSSGLELTASLQTIWPTQVRIWPSSSGNTRMFWAGGLLRGLDQTYPSSWKFCPSAIRYNYKFILLRSDRQSWHQSQPRSDSW